MKRMIMVLGICLLSATLAGAAGTINWTGTGGDNLWTNTANWDVVPDSPDIAYIDATGNDPLINTDVPGEYGRVDIGANNTDLVGLTISDGLLSIEPTAGKLAFRYNTYFNMTGGEISAREVLFAYTDTTNGEDGGTFVFNISGGEINTTNRVTLGDMPGHHGGTGTMSGGTINSASYMSVGHAVGDQTTFNMSGGYIETSSFVTGLRGPGTVNMTGGEIYSTSKLRFGENVGTGIFNLEDGLLRTDGYVAVGYGTSPNGTDVINMTGGEIRCGEFLVGRYGDGEVNLSGGVINMNYYDELKIMKFETNGGEGVLNMCGGLFCWMYGDYITEIGAFVDSDNIVAYDGSGRVLTYIDSGNTYIVADDTAHTPMPTVGEVEVNPALDTLEWELPFPGETVYCDVWIGTEDPNVNPASFVKVVDYQAISSLSYDFAPEQTYYWQVDTYDPITSGKTEGVLWTFETNGNGAQDPTPVSGAVDILKAQVLSWTMAGTFDTVEIYIGADDPGNMVLANSQLASDMDYHYDGLEYGKTYYWRVDSVTANDAVSTGPEWNFTTVTPVCQMGMEYGDLSGDCRVGLEDFAIMATNWLRCEWDISEACN